MKHKLLKIVSVTQQAIKLVGYLHLQYMPPTVQTLQTGAAQRLKLVETRK